MEKLIRFFDRLHLRPQLCNVVHLGLVLNPLAFYLWVQYKHQTICDVSYSMGYKVHSTRIALVINQADCPLVSFS